MIRVLIADDESIILGGILGSVAWTELGMEVVATARNGEAALKAIEKHRPELCLLDVRMPKIDGLEVARRYLAMQPEGVAILITGYDEFSYAQQAVNAGVFAYILKPVDEEELVRTVERAGLRIRTERQKNSYPGWWEQPVPETEGTGWEALLRGLLAGAVPPERIAAERLLRRLEPPVLVQAFRFGPGRLRGVKDELDGLLPGRDAGEANLFPVEMPENILCVLLTETASSAEDAFIRRLVENLLCSQAVTRVQERAPRLSDIPRAYGGLWEKVQKAGIIPPVVHSLLGYVSGRYSDPNIRLQSIAEEYNIAASYLSRLFSQSIGVPFSQFLREYRIRKSLRHLENANIQIVEVAEKSGFSSQHYFAEAFKQAAGISPSVWRKQHVRQESESEPRG